jgi:capsular exopolysaccharide synthesis family protein
MGGVLGLLAGVGLAFVRDWRDERVRSADEITTLLGVRVLGVVPSISKGSAAARGQRLHLAPQTRESEAFRAIRTALCFGTPRDAKLTILVTSPSHAEGKTTLVSNLGIAMAKAGKKTVIVDSDLRKPMQHRVFSTNGSDAGLADALTGAATCDEVIRHTEVEGLDIIPAGSSTQNPSELLTSESLVRILSRLKARYDLVLVDSPPVGEVADAQILAACCNLTLLVLRAEHSKRIPTQRARDALLSVRATLAGVVVNGVSKRNCRYNHYDWHVPPYYEYHSDDSHGGRLPADTDQPLDSTAWYRDLHEAARETRRRVSEKGKTQTDTNR